MKIKNILLGMAAVLCMSFSSCNEDNEGAIYNQENQGASFLFNAVSETAPASNPIVYVSVIRSKTTDAATIAITGEVKTAGVTGVVVSPTVSFAAGEQEGKIAVDLGPNLAVGEKVQITLTINDADASIGGVKSATLTSYKEYEWESLGIGLFQDNFVCGNPHEVEILQAKGFNRYRAVDPYKECYTIDDAENGDWIDMGARCKFIEFWVDADGTTVIFDSFNTGLNYNAGDGAIIAYYFSDLTDTIESDHSMKVDDKLFQLAPYFYISGLGGWNNTQYDGVIYIQLP